ncbi:unnamed protein product [Meloidogyne enterolobii]|uniref:Uncharacterized protein n=1 Tax=Meloidogyne enterolobii TaxID=390850 RepID=A0ACB0XL78_MELEN
MGNYKSRPQLSCADELKKRISEGYAIVRSKLNDDIKPKFDAHTTLYFNCGTSEEFSSQLDQLECVADEKIGVNELSLLHLICIGACEQSEKIRILVERFNNNNEITTNNSVNQKIIKRRKSFLEQRTKNGYTPLHIAIYKGEKEAAITLLASGADPNGVQPSGVPPPLHLAAMTGNAELIEILVSHGADLKAYDFVRYTALHCAAYFGHEMAVKELIAAGADPNACGSVHDRPIHISAGKANPCILKAFLAVGADPTLEDDEGNTSLHFAAKTGHSSSIGLLLSKAGEKEEIKRQFALKTNIYGDTALHSACYMGRTDAAKQLLNTIGSEVLSMVKLFELIKMNFLKENLFSETPLMAACTAGRFELVCFLMRQPEVDPNHQAQDGHTALHSACYHGHIRVVQYLLDNGADQSLTARASDNLLIAKFGNSAILPSINGSLSSKISSLIRSDSTHSQDFKPLLDIQKDNDKFVDGQFQPQTPILWAYEKGHDQVVHMLKVYANKRPDSDACSEYSSGSSSYTPLPSPLGRLRSMTKEKAEILQLRAELRSTHHLSLLNIDLKEPIGNGSFGKVYRGIYRGKCVAVKRYKVVAFGAKTEVDMFCREVSIVSHLKHPNVVAFVGACMEVSFRFFIENKFFYRIQVIFEMNLRFGVGVDIARGMHYLHELIEKPVIHRDLNSHNILLHNNGRAVNLRWMAPEVFTQSCRYDHKVDVFSFALVLWEIHTAELPFSHLKPAAAAAEMAYKRNRPPLPSEPNAQFPKHIIDILNQAWQPGILF